MTNFIRNGSDQINFVNDILSREHFDGSAIRMEFI